MKLFVILAFIGPSLKSVLHRSGRKMHDLSGGISTQSTRKESSVQAFLPRDMCKSLAATGTSGSFSLQITLKALIKRMLKLEFKKFTK